MLLRATPCPAPPSPEGGAGQALVGGPYDPGFALDARVRLLLVGPRSSWASLAVRLLALGVHVHRAETPLEAEVHLRTYVIRAALVAPECWGALRFGIPVILHPIPDRLEARLHALESGADDALTTGTSDREILARLTAVLRRTGGHP